MELAPFFHQWSQLRGPWGQVMDLWLLCFLVVCTYTDFRFHKIYNKVTLPTMVGFVALHGLGGGLAGLGTGVVGLVTLFALFLVVGLMGGMGGGDIKFMAAAGAFFGWRLGLWAAFWAIMGAGIMAVVVMAGRGTLWQTVKRVGHTLRTVITPGLAVEGPSRDDSEPVPFGVGASCGIAATWVLSVLGWLPPLPR